MQFLRAGDNPAELRLITSAIKETGLLKEIHIREYYDGESVIEYLLVALVVFL